MSSAEMNMEMLTSPSIACLQLLQTLRMELCYQMQL